VLIDRQLDRHRGVQLTNREFIYRSANELGWHIIGYELQKVFAIVDWFDAPPVHEYATVKDIATASVYDSYLNVFLSESMATRDWRPVRTLPDYTLALGDDSFGSDIGDDSRGPAIGNDSFGASGGDSPN